MRLSFLLRSVWRPQAPNTRHCSWVWRINAGVGLLQVIMGVLGLSLAIPALADYSQRAEAQAFIRMMEERHGFEPRTVASALANVTPDRSALGLIVPPKTPAARSWHAYRKRFVEPHRIEGGQRFWQQNRAWLERAERQYGVPASIIVAVIGVETGYGRHTGDFQTLSALATLAFDYPPRSALFLRELEHLFVLARQQGRPPSDYHGSYAGALGIPQFLPSSVLNYAVDFDGDGRIDLETSVADAIGSVARYLAQHGWVSGAPIAQRVTPSRPEDLSVLTESGILPRLGREELAKAGIHLDDAAGAGPFALLDFQTPNAPTEYWLTHYNFYVISRYNHSRFYAMSVYHLAKALE
jgi:membrane-bound lytic murein transglycosylase B